MVVEELKSQLAILADNIKWYRRAKRWRQVDLAAKTNINPRYLQDIESGKVNMTMESLLKIAGALEVALLDLLRLQRIYTQLDMKGFVDEKREQIDKINLAVGARDPEATFLYGNPGYESLFERPISNAIGQSIFTFMPEEVGNVFKTLIEPEKNGFSRCYLLNGTKASGETVVLRACPVCLISGKVYQGTLTGLSPLSDENDQEVRSYFKSIYHLQSAAV